MDSCGSGLSDPAHIRAIWLVPRRARIPQFINISTSASACSINRRCMEGTDQVNSATSDADLSFWCHWNAYRIYSYIKLYSYRALLLSNRTLMTGGVLTWKVYRMYLWKANARVTKNKQPQIWKKTCTVVYTGIIYYYFYLDDCCLTPYSSTFYLNGGAASILMGINGVHGENPWP